MTSRLKPLAPLFVAFCVPALLGVFGASALAASPSPSASVGSEATPAVKQPATAGAAGSSSGTTVGDPTKGQTLYESTCASCHGASLEGGVGPKLNPIQHIEGAPANPLDPNYLITTITNGKSGALGTMPPKGGNTSLSPQDIKDIAAYIIQQNKIAPGTISSRDLAVSNVQWVTITTLLLLAVAYLLARYNMRWIARRAARR